MHHTREVECHDCQTKADAVLETAPVRAGLAAWAGALTVEICDHSPRVDSSATYKYINRASERVFLHCNQSHTPVMAVPVGH